MLGVSYHQMSSTHRVLGSMQDARFATSWGPACARNDTLRSSAGIKSWDNTSYRQYLQTNGKQALVGQGAAAPCGPYQCADLGAAVGAAPPAQTSVLSAPAGLTPFESQPTGRFAPYSSQ